MKRSRIHKIIFYLQAGFILMTGCTRIGVCPLADKTSIASTEATIVSGKARFTLLTPAMIRMEWSPSGCFEDRPSLVFIRRNLPAPSYKTTVQEGWLVIETSDLVLRYKVGSGKFSSENLEIRVKAKETPALWRPGQEDKGNLGGTTRTLDQVSGSTTVSPGLISHDGWVLIDDSKTLLFDESDLPWATPRRRKDALDWYFLGYGHNYKQALYDYTLVTGAIPLPPRWIFGAWWSRYWAYKDTELKELVREFNEHDVPLDVLVVDMDWHLDGWTGYTWNSDYFPDPEGFLKWCHDQGLRVTLNLHPADGVGRHEAAFPEVARAMGNNPKKVKKIPFEVTNPRYMKVYFQYLHHPLEQQGIDFWWIDWQQGKESGMKGIDPLFWLNYMHWTDMERNPMRAPRRPILFSRWGGLGNHRYQIGFSGDTYNNWETLAFQPEFTATAGNVCYPFWSHDIGGHMPGPVDGELYTRWIQWAVFSPCLRTHTTKNPRAERRIWAFPDEIFQSAREAFRLRYALIPYIYTMARKCHDSSLPLVRPLYYEWPELDKAYERKDEYLFGDALLVAPVVKARDQYTSAAVSSVWFPPGEWRHWFTGEVFEGPCEKKIMTPLHQIPVFVRSGCIIPTMQQVNRSQLRQVDPLILNIFPGREGYFRLYEDDGDSVGYLKGEYSFTPIEMKKEGNIYLVNIGPAEGSYPGMLDRRIYEVRIPDIWPPRKVLVNDQDVPRVALPEETGSLHWWYDTDNFSMILRIPSCSVREKVSVAIDLCSEDDALLREGLRGRLALLKEFSNLFRDKTPPSVTRFLNEYILLFKDSRNVLYTPYFEEELINKWGDMVREFSKADVDEYLKLQANMRLLGLYANMEITGKDKGTIEAAITAEVLQPVQDLSARIELEPPDGWKTDKEYLSEEIPLNEGHPLEQKMIYQVDNEIFQTAILKVRISLKISGETMDVPLERIVLPSINSWRVIGPFDNPSDSNLETVFPPEKEIDLYSSYKGKDAKTIKWQKSVRAITPGANLTGEFFVNLNELFGKPYTDAVAYALSYLDSPEDVQAVLSLGSDDGVVVWLNGKEIHRNPAARPYASKQDRVDLKLRKGVNTLLLKISQGPGAWGFCCHIETPDGKPLTLVKTGLNP